MEDNYKLKNGSRIGVVGAGPAGTFFSYFFNKYAKEKGIDAEIILIDRKKFHERGATGCNMCAGIISSNLIRKMENADINLPENVVQRYIRGYLLETKGVSLHLEKKTKENIATVFRGRGPRGSALESIIGFDEFLLNLVFPFVNRVQEYVKDIKFLENKVELETSATSTKIDVDAIVVACGLNSNLLDRLEELGFGYKKPESFSTMQVEIPLPEEEISFRFNDYIYTYNIGLKNLYFAAIIPKKGYLTVSLIGENITRDTMLKFLGHPKVKRRFPPGWNFSDVRNYCFCKPLVPISHAKNAFTDRLVAIGDANCSRLFKNGLESAFITAEAAAKIIVDKGFSKKAFKEGFSKTTNRLILDNYYGRILFAANKVISENNLLSEILGELALKEQLEDSAPLNDILWDMLTGEDYYKNISKRLFNYHVIFKMLKKGYFSLISLGK